MKNKFSLTKLFDSDQFLKIFSLIAAVCLYFVIAMITKESVPHTIYNVPVQIDAKASNLANQQLSIIEGAEYTVDIRINGPRTLVGQLKPDSPELATEAVLTGITGAGTHSVPLRSAVADVNALPFTIESYSPANISVQVDRLRTATFDIRPIVNGNAVAEGYLQDSIKVSPEKVTVTGPEAELAKVARADVTLELTESLTANKVETLPIQLKDAQGEVIDLEDVDNHLSMDVTEASVVITVHKTTELPLEVSFLTPPRNFPVDELSQLMTIEPYSIAISGPAGVIDSMTEISLGYIDIKELRPGNTTTIFPLAELLPDEVNSLQKIPNATVTFDDSNWGTARFNISEIRKVNEPYGYNVEVLADQFHNVEFAGDLEILESITADSIVAEVDLGDRELTPGQSNYPVKISVPGKGLVWAVEEQTVAIQVTERE